MKVIQINTVSGRGSTGSNAVELAKSLEIYGVETLIAYGQGSSNYKNSYKIGTTIENKLHNVLSRITGKQGYFSTLGTINFIKQIKEYSPDLIHLNNLHGNFLNIELLMNFLIQTQMPVVWTLHDCWPFTGKCAHYIDIGCQKWKNECHNCPKVKEYPPSIYFDKSKSLYNKKKGFYNDLKNVTVVGVSKWISNEARESILANHKIIDIYNWIELDIFKPLNGSLIRKKYNIDKDKFILLGVSGSWSNAKGISDWIKLSNYVSEEVQIVLVGKENRKYGKIPSNIIHIPYTEDKNELAEIYSSADAFLSLSRAESFGKTIAESLSCGTPAIVFDVAACSELIGDGCGYVVRNGDLNDVIEAIRLVMQNGKEYYHTNCLKFSKNNFDLKKNTRLYFEVYKNAFNNKV